MPENYKEKLTEDLNRRINPEVSRKFHKEKLIERRDMLLSLGRDSFFLPQHAISVVGTNAKGSTSFFLSSYFQETHEKVGLYTSPHLMDFNERIRINRNPVSHKLLYQTLIEVKDFLDDHKIEDQFSYFEILTLLALRIFKNESCSINIIEAGLGGRYDATKMAYAQSAVLTTISMDHIEILGNSKKDILKEKLGIIGERTEKLFVMNRNFQNEIDQFLHDNLSIKKQNKQNENLKPLLISYYRNIENQEEYLTYNQTFAKWVYESISGKKTELMPESPPGRMEKRKYKNKTIIFDTAHNEEALIKTISQIRSHHPSCIFLFAFLADRDPSLASSVCRNFMYDKIYFIEQDGFRTDDKEKKIRPQMITGLIDSYSDEYVFAFLGTHRTYEIFYKLTYGEAGSQQR